MINKIAYIEMYVSNLAQATLYYQTGLGFDVLGSRGLNTGNKESASTLLKHQDAYIILTSPLRNDTDIARHIAKHGDGIKNIAFITEDALTTYEKAIQHGANPVTYADLSPDTKCVSAFGDTIHTFLDNTTTWQTQFVPHATIRTRETTAFIQAIDHVAICIPSGELDQWVNYYCNAYGFLPLHDEHIDTGKGGMNSKAIQSPNGNVKLVFVEPIAKYQTSQLHEFLDYYQGPGVQHVAYATHDILMAKSHLTQNGIAFLRIPETYYSKKATLFPELAHKMPLYHDHQVLLDKDEKGNYLFQAFSIPIQTRPTCFLELIQRNQCEGFGSRNVIALFKAMEEAQMARGTL